MIVFGIKELNVNDNDTDKLQLVLCQKPWTYLLMHQAFKYVSLTKLGCMKTTWNFLKRGREHTTTNFLLPFWTWIRSLRIQSQEKWLTFDKLGWSNRRDKVWKDENFLILIATFSMTLYFWLLYPDMGSDSNYFRQTWPGHFNLAQQWPMRDCYLQL